LFVDLFDLGDLVQDVLVEVLELVDPVFLLPVQVYLLYAFIVLLNIICVVPCNF
jgi:hypothetical protein